MVSRRRLPFASKLFAGLALSCGLTAFLLVRGLEARLAASHPSGGAPVLVVVAVADAARGTVLDAAMLDVQRIPSAFAPPGALRAAADAVGRVLVADVAKGEVLTRTRLSSSSSAGPVAALIPAGLRAISVVAAVSPGDLRPGDRVDLLAAYGGVAPHVETVGRALEVLRVTGEQGPLGPTGVGAGADSGAVAKASLLLLVGPDDAQRLALAQAFASLSVTIVPPEP